MWTALVTHARIAREPLARVRRKLLASQLPLGVAEVGASQGPLLRAPSDCALPAWAGDLSGYR